MAQSRKQLCRHLPVKSVSKITKDEALRIAGKRLQEEAFSKDIDANRITIRQGDYGPKDKVRTCWTVDFARHGAQEITAGLWDRGYLVAIDSETGDIVEATGYKR